MRIARALLRTYYGLLPGSELVSLGHLGLVRAATRFDHERGVPFEGFVSARVRGAMLDGIRVEATRRREARLVAAIAAERRGRDSDMPPSGDRVSFSGVGVDSQRTVAIRAATMVIVAEIVAASSISDERMGRVLAAVAMLSTEDQALFDVLCQDDRSLSDIARDLGVCTRTLKRHKAALIQRVRAEIS